jgi:hypothetical protein
MSNTLETIKHEGLTIEIHYDENCESPREWDNLSTFAFFHRNYKNESEEVDHNDFNGWDEMRNFIESKNGLDAICLPVYLYSHSGDTVSTSPFSCPWDSGQLGFAYVTREQARNDYGCKRITRSLQDQILKRIEGEVETFDDYIRGNVYGWIVLDENGEELDSCWGYLGDMDYCIQEAKHHAEYEAKRKVEIDTANSCVI